VTSAQAAEEFFGRGSMLAEMLKKAKAVDAFMDTWGLALDDNAAGATASGNFTVTGTPTEAGTLNLYIAGTRVQVAVTVGQTDAQVATAIAAAINADTTLPVTAAAALGVATVTARHKGETGNDIDLRLNYFAERTPKGIAVAVTAMSGGTSNPDVATAIAAMGAEWWNWIVMPYTDAANLTALEAELDARWGPLQQKGARAFAAFRGNHAQTATFGDDRNNPHVSTMGTNIAPEPPYLWAAVNAMAAARRLALDPARPVQRIELTGLKSPDIADRWTDSERNLLLFDGISTYTVGSDGTVLIERQITMYQENTAAIADDSYLNIETPETLERIRFEQRARILQKFPQFKLSDTDEEFGAGQPVVTRDVIRAELLDLYQLFIERAWAQDLESYDGSLIVEIDTVQSRVNVQDSPRLIGQYRIHAMQSQFRR
jgi:phage tail sheath gpL-like